MTNPVTITAPEGVPFIEIEREFDAPVDAVFNAHRDPELVKQWLGPNGYEMDIERWDFTTAGRLPLHAHERRGRVLRLQRHVPHRARERVRHPDVRVRGLPRRRGHRVDDVRRPRRRPHAAAASTRVYPTVESRDGMVASGMESGVREGYERLDAIVAA